MVVCDRCKELVDQRELNEKLFEIRKLAEPQRPFLFAYKKGVHLCPKCLKSFNKWWYRPTSHNLQSLK